MPSLLNNHVIVVIPTTPVKITDATAIVVMPPISWVTVMAIGVVMDLVVKDSKVL